MIVLANRTNFVARLRRCQHDGLLSTADLAHWFGRPHSTVRLWVNGDYAPREPGATAVYNRLVLLEEAIGSRTFPVVMSAHMRPAYVKQVRDNAERGRFSSSRTA